MVVNGRKEKYLSFFNDIRLMKEDGKTEFKKQFTKESMKTVVAFSNTTGGTLYYGIDDDGSAVGIADLDATSLDIVHHLSDAIRPDDTAITDISRIVIDDKDIIKIDVQEGPSKPYYLRDKGLRSEGVYIRKGPSSIQAPDSLILSMIKDCSTSFESSISLNQELTFDTAAKIFAEADVEFGDNQMNTLGFYEGDLFTNLAYLISDQCTAGIKLAAYSDRYKTEFLNRSEVRGCILSQAKEAMKFIDVYNPLRSKIAGLRRTDYRAYPDTALREVLINAVVHRDYSLNADILVSIYGDCISVSSYGGLRKGLGVDDIMKGISSPRNPRLAQIFYRLGFIESYGTGIPRMMGSYRDALIKPSIELSTNIFKVNLPAIEPAAVDQASVDTIIDLGRSCESFTRMEAEDACGESRSKTGEILSDMVREGLLERMGNGRGVRYRLPRNR